jgi:hypothetical protein
MNGDQRSGDSADSRRDFKEHPNANVGVALAHVGCGSPGGGRNHRDKGRADRVADIDVKSQGEKRHDHDPAAQARQGAEKTRRNRSEKNEDGQIEYEHVLSDPIHEEHEVIKPMSCFLTRSCEGLLTGGSPYPP